MEIFNYADCERFNSFLDDVGTKVLTRDELIRAYVNNLYGVTLKNFGEAEITPPTKEEIADLRKCGGVV